MESIIDQLYSGEINPAAMIEVTDPKAKEVSNKLAGELEYLKKHLPAEAHSHLDNLEGLYLNRCSMDTYAGFQSGFKLATLLMAEVITGSEGF